MKKKIIVIFLCLIIFINLMLRENNLEPFDYLKCRNYGFSQEFCIETPIIIPGPGECICETGEIGEYKLGYGQSCMCE